MPKVPTHALTWSRERGLYELHPADPLLSSVVPGEEEPWFAWLTTHASFAFQGQAGRLNLLKEPRPRGGGYWYAYHSHQGQARKQYLGRTDALTLARLEAVAQALGTEPASQGARAKAVPRCLHSAGASHVRGSTRKASAALSLEIPLTSLAPPPLPNSLVEREPLLSRLDGALSHPLTLVSAGAGWGKTTVLSAWASRHKGQIAWLLLSELDNSPTRFWIGLIAALRRSAPASLDLGQTAVALLQSPQPPELSAILTTLLNELASHQSHPAPTVLILDDYQVISDPAIHEGLCFWVEHQPAHLHLLLSSRSDPDLPLSRLRVRGQLIEIREADLGFSLQEASQFLRQMLAQPLSEDEVRQLSRRTEGWIAGLQLAALALQQRADRAAFLQTFTGSQRYLLDYVQEEILARLPESVRDFLLCSAILSRLDASVCQAVTVATERQACQQMLVYLERANLFLVPLDEERHTYRLHDLFREALLSVLHTHHPEVVPLLHRRAADFYAAKGQWHEAITHALLASDYSLAARLMERTVEQFWVRGEAATIARWVLTLPAVLVREHARLLLTIAFYLLTTGVHTAEVQRERCHTAVRQLMARVEMALRRESDEISQEVSAPHTEVGTVSPVEDREARAAEDARLYRRLHLLHLCLVLNEVATSGDHERWSSMLQETEEELERDEEAIWQLIPLACSFVLHYTIRQEGASLVPQLLEAKERASREASRYATYAVRQYLAMAAVEAGRLHLAYEESRTALTLIEQMAGYALLKGYFEFALAQILYQWNRLEEARDLLHTVAQDAAAWHNLDLLAGGYGNLLQVALATGDWSLAELSLHEVEQLVQRERFVTFPGWLLTMRAQWWLAQGQLEAASDWAAGVVFPQGAWEFASYDVFPFVMRVYFAQRRWKEALELLDSFSTHLDRQANIRITITYLAQSLVALHQVGKRDQAREIAVRLLALTEPEGYLRVYLDEGEPMREALLAVLTSHSQQHELAASTRASIAKLLAAFEHEGQGANRSPVAAPALAPAPSPARQALAISSTLGASLTRREQEVLRLLAAGASNQDIAQTLVISLETVKKHVSHLLGKLEATSRTQAIAQARARSLL